MKLTNLGIVILTISVTTGVLQADTFVVAPNGASGTELIGASVFPFNPLSLRLQQVYGASEFSALSGPAYITQIIFRPDFQGAAFSLSFPDIQINLSTTSAAVDGLSTTFASNVGADNTEVYARGSLALSSLFTGPASGPKDFDVVINLTTAFWFDPSAGNLLLDVRNFGGGTGNGLLDLAAESGDGVSRVLANFSVNSPTANVTDSVGLVTQFRFSANPVPEPSTWLLLATATGLVLLATRRKHAARE